MMRVSAALFDAQHWQGQSGWHCLCQAAVAGAQALLCSELSPVNYSQWPADEDIARADTEYLVSIASGLSGLCGLC